MTTVELKNFLIHRIAAIDDKTFLTAIKTIIETKSETTIYQTSAEQRVKIMEGRNQIAKGESFSNEQVEKEIDKWLSEK
jgi:hypothetical protein